LTPATVHYGQAESVLRQRQEVLDVAYQRHPERFVRSAPTPPALPSEVWINKPVSTPEPLSVEEDETAAKVLQCRGEGQEFLGGNQLPTTSYFGKAKCS
jgi:putative transposase